MEPQLDCLVSGTLATMLRLSRYVGLAPLTFIKKQQGWNIRLSHAWTVYGYIFATIFNTCAIVTILLDFTIGGKSVDPRTILSPLVYLWLVNSILVIVITSLSGYRALSHMKSIISCLDLVQKVKVNLSSSKCPKERNIKLLIILLALIICLSFINKAVIALQYPATKSTIIILLTYIFFGCTYSFIQLIEVQFTMVTLQVWNIFKVINDDLRGMTLGVSPSSAPLYNRRVRRLSSAYVSICDAVRELNRSYGLILILMLVFYIISLNVSFYIFIKVFVFDLSTLTNMQIMSKAIEHFWLLQYVVTIWIIIEPCHMTHAEMAKTAELVGVLMRDTYSTYQPLAVELEAFHRLLVLNQPSYSPLEAVVMSRPLELTMLGSISTYLILFLQLPLADKNN